MAVSLGAVAKTAEATATGSLCDGGTLKIYSGTVPANADASLGAAVLLATLTFASPAMVSVSGGVATADAIVSDSNAAASGTAAFFRVYESDGVTPVMQGSVTATGGNGDVTIDSISIAQHAVVSITGLTYTRP